MCPVRLLYAVFEAKAVSEVKIPRNSVIKYLHSNHIGELIAVIDTITF
jgi:hypothetical protein